MFSRGRKLEVDTHQPNTRNKAFSGEFVSVKTNTKY